MGVRKYRCQEIGGSPREKENESLRENAGENNNTGMWPWEGSTVEGLGGHRDEDEGPEKGRVH